MIWRRSMPEDHSDILSISREPMDGKIKLIWGLDRLEAPRGCHDLQVFVIEDDGKVQATACSWLWPSGDRYLSGLRFSSGFKKRPPRDIWKQAFHDMLAGTEIAWTSIGKQNTRARRLLASKQSYLPHYRPRAELTTWFVPLPDKQRRASHQKDDRISDTGHIGLEAAEWRHVAIASGSGLSYLAGRSMHKLGLPGIPAPGRRMKLAYLDPRICESSLEMKDIITQATGWDGIVVVLEKASVLGREWRTCAPKLSWQWESTLYQVSWDANQADQAIPDWKGIWL